MPNDDTGEMTPLASALADVVIGAPAGTGPQMSLILANSKWSRRAYPFAHIHVEDVLVAPVYEQVLAAFRGVLACRAEDRAGSARLAYHGETFDGYLMPFHPDLKGALALFVSKAWVDLLARATGVTATRDVNGALHHHAKGSRHGFVHKDYSACWFIENPRPDGINITDNARCHYRTGKTPDGELAQERVRAVAMIYYLNNPAWAEGDGGETGLYLGSHDPVERPAAIIPPVNNSMLVFECSPYSYHSFISNRRNARSSIAMWLHRTKADAVGKWGADSIVYVRN